MRGILYIIIGSACYGVLSTFVKLAYNDGFKVNDVVGIQMFIGALLLWTIVLFNKRKKSKPINQQFSKPTKKEILLLTILGSTTGLTGMFYYLSLQYIPASLAIVLLFQFTWIGVLFESLINRKLPEKNKLLSLIPLIIGTLFATNVITSGLTINLLGLLFGLFSAISYSIFILLSGRVALQTNPFTKTALMITGGFIICAIILPPNFFLNGKLFIEITLKYGLILGFLGPFFSTLMFSKGVPLTGSGLASILGATELPTAILMSALVLKEAIGSAQYIGIFLILIGIALPEILRKRMLQVS
ncbi:DMT family transporter [Bacillus sp. EAC]|uniref:EamA family transporter n=1 Tax=Bacillus sp. EAC TaxID=1978338 RepID=UPI000B442C45|nr:DMT family transporter [Bacillus sp. EAC]